MSINIRLVAGGILLIVIIGLALFGPLLAPYDLSHSTKIRTVITEAGLEVYGAPFPPAGIIF